MRPNPYQPQCLTPATDVSLLYFLNEKQDALIASAKVLLARVNDLAEASKAACNDKAAVEVRVCARTNEVYVCVPALTKYTCVCPH